MDLTNGTGGYVYLTGELNDDLYFRLAKYFLQVLAGVTNEDIVVDPQGWLLPGEKRSIPFDLSETDISGDVILLSPAPWTMRFWLETPNGQQITPADAAGLPALQYVSGQHSAYYRASLPLPVGPDGAREGAWKAYLEVNEDLFKRYVSSLEGQEAERDRVRAHGIRYSVNVHSYSNLHMRARLSQGGFVPGSTLFIRAVMSEYGLPMTARADLRGAVTWPDGSAAVLDLAETEPGVFETELHAGQPGVYVVRVVAEGRTLRGRDFTREQTLTGAVWQGGERPTDADQPRPGDGHGRGDLCRLLHCLLSQQDFVDYLGRRDLPVETIRACVEKACPSGSAVRVDAHDLLVAQPELREAIAAIGRFLSEGDR